MSPTHRYRIAPLSALLCLGIVGGAASADSRPDILVIVADDLGFSDPGCFGGEIPTPALDRLAAEGLRLTGFHNGGMCVVSRVSLMTGKWWPRGQKEFRKDKLLSERLQEQGYRTALIGKWHLIGDPMDRGFDRFFGFLGGFANHFEGGRDYRIDREPFSDFGPDYYSSDAFAERAVEFIEAGKESGRPFFLYLSFQAPHNPLQAPREDILRHRGRYLVGWQAVREARFRRQVAAGLFPPSTQLPPYPRNLPQWSDLSPAQRDLEDLRMATYAAMVERMDRGIARALEALDRTGRAEDTLVVFLSDNGADPFAIVDSAMLGEGKLPGDRRSNYQPGTGWAYAAVTPWRLYKISQHAGGVTTGAIVRWPAGGVKAGRIERADAHIADLAPTLLEAATLPVRGAGIDGESLLALLQGQEWQRRGPMYFQFFNNRAIRTAKWTLAEVDAAGWELFDATGDPLEIHDLAPSRPDVVDELEALWNRWWTVESGRAGYEPASADDNPHYWLQGDRGTSPVYVPSAMPETLKQRIPVPARS